MSWRDRFTKTPSELHGVAPAGKAKKPYFKKIQIILLPVFFVVFGLAYYVAISMEWYAVEIAYMVLIAGLAVSFVVLNRGFVLQGVTPEMLPDSMKPEEKQRLLESRDRRAQISAWLLVFLIPLLVVFLIEMIILFFIPTMEGIFHG